jgi:hypothetical protein
MTCPAAMKKRSQMINGPERFSPFPALESKTRLQLVSRNTIAEKCGNPQFYSKDTTRAGPKA